MVIDEAEVKKDAAALRKARGRPPPSYGGRADKAGETLTINKAAMGPFRRPFTGHTDWPG
jgi:hypothetical protein